jgi:hypothetical protein
MRGIRPDIVANDTTNASARMLLEAKTSALCPSNYGTRFAANGDTWMEARARKAVVERDTAAKKLDDVVFPNVQPPPMATQLQNLGGVSAIVVGAFCEHNDQVHSLCCDATGLVLTPQLISHLANRSRPISDDMGLGPYRGMSSLLS